MKYKLSALLLGITIIFCSCISVRADYLLAESSSGTQMRIPVPDMYIVSSTLYSYGEAGLLNRPMDLFVDPDDNIYIADTGNNRIVKLNPDLSFNRVYDASNSVALNKPEGIYVDKYEDLFVADTGNKRVVHIAADGSFIEEFTKPSSELAEYDNADFIPTKLGISLTGYLYVIRQYTLMIIDAQNEFRGFIMSSDVKLTAMDIFLNIIFTDEQRAKRAKMVPESFLNFVIGRDGMVYGTTLTNTAQIKKFNAIGTNIYTTEKTFGEIYVDTRGKTATIKNPEFIAIAVDRNGIITVVDRNTNNLYQYDQEGNNIGVFGGPGLKKGRSTQPAGLAVDSGGRIYLLGAQMGSLQVYEPTEYCRSIHSAISYYYNGRYTEAVTEWENVHKMHEGNQMAHIGLAQALYKQGDYRQAMDHYKIANDREGYSEAFREYRHEILRKYFGLIVLAGVILLILLIKVTGAAKYFTEIELG